MVAKSAKNYRTRKPVYQRDDCITISDFDRKRIIEAYYRYYGNHRLAARGLQHGPKRIKNVWLAAGLEIRYHEDYKGVKPKQNSRERGGLERKL